MSAVYNSTVQGFYLSYYGRPADPAGLTFWTGQLAAAGGNLSSILNAFGTSAEATRRYGTGTTESKIQAVYQQTFGRAADPAGLAFYNTEITAGRITLIDMSKRIIDGATGDDVAIRNNRLSAAQSFTDKLDTDAEKAGYSGSGAEDAARAWVATVTKDAATVTAAVATADATITSLLPQTFALTTGVDKFTGSTGNDSFTAGATALSSSDTLGATDVIDGGAGEDTIAISVSKDFAGFTQNVGSMKNIETVNLTNTTTSNFDFTARGVSGVTTYNTKGTLDVLGLDSLAAKVNVSGLSATTAATNVIGFNTEVVSGTNDSYSIGLDSLGRPAVTTTPTQTETAHNITIDGVENLTISATGASYVALKSDNMKTLTVSGEGSLKVNEVGTAAKSVDASGLKGGIDVNISESTSGVSSLKGGAGADTFRVGSDAANTAATNLLGNATISGGDGADTLRISTAAGTATTAYNMTSVETVRLETMTNNLTFSGINASGINKVYVTSGATTTTSTFSDMGTAELAVEIQAGGTAAHTVVTDSAGAVNTSIAVSAAAASDSNETASDSVTLDKATSATLTIPTHAIYTGVLTATKATSATVTIAGDTDAGFRINSPTMTSLTVNQTSATKAAVLLLSTTAADAGSSTLESLNLTVGAGGMTVNNNVATNKLSSLTVSTAAAFTYSTASDTENTLTGITKVDLSGSATGAAVTLGALGATGLQYGVSLVATGLKGSGTDGLTLSTVDTAAGQAISLDISGVDGDTSIGAVTVASTSGSLNLNAKGHGDATGDTIAVGNMSAGTVTIDLTDVTGNVTLGAGGAAAGITGNSVSVTATSAAGTLTVRDAADLTTTDIAVRDSLTFFSPDLDDQIVAVSVSSGSKAFTGNIKGSVLADQFQFTSASTDQTSITLTGALGAGTNILNVTSSLSTVTGGQTIDVSGVTSVSSGTLIGGAYADVIKGTSGNDTIRAGAGADTLTGGGGNDVFTLNSASDTGALSTSAGVTKSNGTTAGFTGGYTITGGEYVSTAALDKITDFGNGDRIVTNSGDTTHTTFATVGSALTAGKEAYIYGSYSASLNRFTFSASGSDMLYAFDVDGTDGAGDDSFGAIVLIGYAQVLKNDTNAAPTGVIGAAS